ncbi:hypothetical protein BJF79_24950 [Actinomadura sp. CNU-125]|nr:hypothetical protein BJF79_24950 [Actinomadura sp. CNU-125]
MPPATMNSRPSSISDPTTRWVATKCSPDQMARSGFCSAASPSSTGGRAGSRVSRVTVPRVPSVAAA